MGVKLPKEEVELFFKLHPALLAYANQRLKLVKNVSTADEFMRAPPEEKVRIRDALYNRMDLIDSFIDENPFNFSREELEIVLSWKHLLRGTFFVLQYLKNYTVFLDSEEPPKAYGVLALNDGFDELLGPYLPVTVKTVLLPFREKIIYDGLMNITHVIFGGGARRGLTDDFREAEHRFGIVTSLPYLGEEKEKSDAETLRFYLRSRSSREKYGEEIAELIDKNPDILKVYHQETGKSDARTYGRRLRELGLTGGWFAILEGVIIASGKTKEEVNGILDGILSPEKRDFVHVFQLKGAS